MTHTAYFLLDVLYTLLLKNKFFFNSDTCDIAIKLFNKSDDFSGVGGGGWVPRQGGCEFLRTFFFSFLLFCTSVL